MPDVPDTLLVVGGGVIGLELGQVYASLGSKVSVVEFLPNLIPGADPDIVKPLQRKIKKQIEKSLEIVLGISLLNRENDSLYKNLTIENCPRPEMGPHQVRIKVQAAGVSFATSLVVAGKYQRKPPLPFIPGTECSGYVTDVGSDVTDMQIGDRVCAVLDWGGQAEEAVAHSSNVFKIPDSLPFNEAICFTNSYLTSYAALVWPHLLQVKEGQFVLVHGAAGGVGIAAIEISKIKGATVIATVGSEDKRKIAEGHGADFTINYNDGGFRERVLELTDNLGANIVYDPVGGDVFLESLRCIAPEGKICLLYTSDAADE